MLLEGNGICVPKPFEFCIKPGISKFSMEVPDLQSAEEFLSTTAGNSKKQYFYDCKLLENGKSIGIFDKETLKFYFLPEKRELEDEILISRNMFYGMWHLSKKSGHEKIAERFLQILRHPQYKTFRYAQNDMAEKTRLFFGEITKTIYQVSTRNQKVADILTEAGLTIPWVTESENAFAYKFLLWDDGYEMLYDCIGMAAMKERYSQEQGYETLYYEPHKEAKKEKQEFEQLSLDFS